MERGEVDSRQPGRHQGPGRPAWVGLPTGRASSDTASPSLLDLGPSRRAQGGSRGDRPRTGRIPVVGHSPRRPEAAPARPRPRDIQAQTPPSEGQDARACHIGRVPLLADRIAGSREVKPGKRRSILAGDLVPSTHAAQREVLPGELSNAAVKDPRIPD